MKNIYHRVVHQPKRNLGLLYSEFGDFIPSVNTICQLTMEIEENKTIKHTRQTYSIRRDRRNCSELQVYRWRGGLMREERYRTEESIPLTFKK